MASSLEFVEYVCEQIKEGGEISNKKMFGEYGIYCDGKVIGLVCDNQLFVKVTQGGAAVIPGLSEASPYTGAKPHFLVEDLENKELLGRFIRSTWEEVPMPKPKKKK